MTVSNIKADQAPASRDHHLLWMLFFYMQTVYYSLINLIKTVQVLKCD